MSKAKLKQKISNLNKQGKFTVAKESQTIIDRMNRINHNKPVVAATQRVKRARAVASAI